MTSKRRHRENIAAGNLALFAVKSQLNEFLLFRKDFYVDVANKKRSAGSPLYLLARPSFHTYVGHTIDFTSLGFLFERTGYAKTFDALHLSQLSYQDLVKIDEFRNTTAVEVQKEIEKLDHTKQDSSLGNIEKAVGPYLIAVMGMLVVGLAKRARDDEKVYQDAFSSLQAALEIELKVWWHIRPHPLISLKEPEPKFRKESLPAMPELLVEALENLDRESAE